MASKRNRKGTTGRRGSNKKKAEQVRGDSLTPQMLLFCETYVLNQRNGADAYLKAYSISAKQSPQYRAQKASVLLARAKIQVKIRELDAKLADKLQERFNISSESILDEIAKLGYANSDDYYEWGYNRVPCFTKKGEPLVDAHGQQVYRDEPYVRFKPSKDLTREQKAAIVGVGMTMSRTGDPCLEVKMANKLGALNDLARIQGFVKTKVEHTGKDGAPIETVTHTLPNLDGVNDPKAMLRAFEDFRMGNVPGRPN